LLVDNFNDITDYMQANGSLTIESGKKKPTPGELVR
jgi:hypothetical protein